MSNGSFLQPAYIWWPHLLNTKSHTSISALSSDHPVPRLSIISGSVFRDKIIIHHRRQHHMILSKRRLFSLKLNSIRIGFLPLLCMYTYKLRFDPLLSIQKKKKSSAFKILPILSTRLPRIHNKKDKLFIGNAIFCQILEMKWKIFILNSNILNWNAVIDKELRA